MPYAHSSPPPISFAYVITHSSPWTAHDYKLFYEIGILDFCSINSMQVINQVETILSTSTYQSSIYTKDFASPIN
jgi:hypothetical protein